MPALTELLTWTLALLGVVGAGRSFDDRLSDAKRRALLVRLRTQRWKLTPRQGEGAFLRVRSAVDTLLGSFWTWRPERKHAAVVLTGGAVYVLCMALWGRQIWGLGASSARVTIFLVGGFLAQVWVDDLMMTFLRSRSLPIHRSSSVWAGAVSGATMIGVASGAAVLIAWMLAMGGVILSFEPSKQLAAYFSPNADSARFLRSVTAPAVGILLIALTTRLAPLAAGASLLASSVAYGLRRLPREVLHLFTHRGAPSDTLKKSFTPLKFLGDVSALLIAFGKLLEVTINFLRS